MPRCFSATRRRGSLLKKIRVQGTEHLENVLALGKRVIAVSAHIRNFTLISMKMVAEGYSFIMVVQESKYEMVAKALRTFQMKQGGRFIYIRPWREALLTILAALRRNEIVCLLADEKKAADGS